MNLTAREEYYDWRAGALAVQVFSRTAGTPLLEGNRIRLLKDANENYPACSIPSGATKPYIRYESYIIHEDETREMLRKSII
jgi:cardiolipin synthase